MRAPPGGETGGWASGEHVTQGRISTPAAAAGPASSGIMSRKASGRKDGGRSAAAAARRVRRVQSLDGRPIIIDQRDRISSSTDERQNHRRRQ